MNYQDLELLNLLRYKISNFFKSKGDLISKEFDFQGNSNVLDLEENLQNDQQICRKILKKLLFRNRFKRDWYSEQVVTVSPSYKWGLLNDPNNYRIFNFNSLSDIFPNADNFSSSVFPPFRMPVLNDPFFTWENVVMKNLLDIENQNLK